MVIEVLALAATIAARRGDAEHAAELVGANWAQLRLTGGLFDDVEEQWLRESGLAEVRDRLGPAWDAAVARGERLTAHEALAAVESAVPLRSSTH
jgi:hypothetical protein